MSKQDEYRQYAKECVESARTATSEAVRKHFLEMAKMWMTAAQQLDDGASVTHGSTSGDDKTTH